MGPAGLVDLRGLQDGFHHHELLVLIRMFQTEKGMQSIVMKDVAAREQATKHFFKRAQRMSLEG